MEYIYAAMLLHKAGKKVEEASLKKILEAAGVVPDEARIKATVAALDGVNIDDAIKSAQVVAAPAQSGGEAKAAEKKEEKKKKEEDAGKSEEAASAGLSALFG